MPEFRCPECGCRCTRGPSGTEYGHQRGRGSTGTGERCSRRPDTVDPKGTNPEYDEWNGDASNRYGAEGSA